MVSEIRQSKRRPKEGEQRLDFYRRHIPPGGLEPLFSSFPSWFSKKCLEYVQKGKRYGNPIAVVCQKCCRCGKAPSAVPSNIFSTRIKLCPIKWCSGCPANRVYIRPNISTQRYSKRHIQKEFPECWALKMPSDLFNSEDRLLE